ncbi:MAG: hypothetical protein U5M51_07730 [Emticicia sp.]|nr:hypothetical protein [Emticicia sp.]
MNIGTVGFGTFFGGIGVEIGSCTTAFCSTTGLTSASLWAFGNYISVECFFIEKIIGKI